MKAKISYSGEKEQTVDIKQKMNGYYNVYKKDGSSVINVKPEMYYTFKIVSK